MFSVFCYGHINVFADIRIIRYIECEKLPITNIIDVSLCKTQDIVFTIILKMEACRTDLSCNPRSGIIYLGHIKFKAVG